MNTIVLYDAAHVYSHRLTIIFNNYIKNSKFPDILKYADITPVFKRGDATDKSNYRPISALTNFSKIFEKIVYSQVNSHMEPKLFKYLTRFRRNHSTQHALLRMIVSWWPLQNKGQKVGTIIMVLSKVIDTRNHKLLLKKLTNFSKIFEKIVYNHVNSHMEPKLFKYLARFRRNHSTQHALLRMIVSWWPLQNKGQKVGAIIMVLSKVIDTRNHKLLLKKLQAYGFDKKSLSFTESYFTNRKQRTKIGDNKDVRELSF